MRIDLARDADRQRLERQRLPGVVGQRPRQDEVVAVILGLLARSPRRDLGRAAHPHLERGSLGGGGAEHDRNTDNETDQPNECQGRRPFDV
jgi:hypothetical protein